MQTEQPVSVVVMEEIASGNKQHLWRYWKGNPHRNFMWMKVHVFTLGYDLGFLKKIIIEALYHPWIPLSALLLVEFKSHVEEISLFPNLLNNFYSVLDMGVH